MNSTAPAAGATRLESIGISGTFRLLSTPALGFALTLCAFGKFEPLPGQLFVLMARYPRHALRKPLALLRVASEFVGSRLHCRLRPFAAALNYCSDDRSRHCTPM